MKTLKKSLCLILAVVMVVGVLAVSASAATFTDDESIQYTEAVEVLAAINVIDGIGDGSFAPTATLTREQGAAIVTRMLLTRSVSDLLTASTTSFSDVASTKWSAGVVEYAAAQGIVAGIGDGTFAPEATLTGVQFAKMLLVALGIDGEYTGNYWATNVITAAEKAGLSDGLSGLDYTDGITREEACQMAYNALNYSASGSTITYKVTSADEATTYYSGASEDTAALIAAIKEDAVLTETESSKDSIAYETYDLSRVTSVDAFGRPTIKVTDTDEDISITVSSAEPVLSYTTAVKSATLYSALGLSSSKSATVIINGETQDETFTIKGTNTEDWYTLGGNGITVEVYKSGSGSNVKYTIVVIQPIFTTVKTVKTATNETTGKKVTTVTFNATNEDGENLTYKSTEFAKGDVVVLTYSKSKAAVQSVELAETVSGTLTKAVNSKTFTIAGNTYQLSAITNADADESTLTNAVGTTVEYYLDTCGYLVSPVSDTAEATNFINILAAETPSKNSNYLSTSSDDYVGAVYGILSNGTYGEFTANWGTSSTSKTGIFEYTVNDDGEIVIGDSADTEELKSFTSGTTSVKNTESGETVYLNSTTTFIYYTQNTTSSSKTIKTFDVQTGNSSSGYVAAGATAVVNSNNVALVVFVGDVYDSTTSADVVFVDASTETATKTATTSGTTTSYSYTAYDASGEEITVTSTTQVTEDGLWIYNTDYSLNSEATTVGGEITAVYGSIIVVDGSAYNTEDVVFLGDESKLTAGQTVIGVVNTSGNTLTALWVTADSE